MLSHLDCFFFICYDCIPGIYDDDPEIITLSHSDFREYNSKPV